MLNKINSKHTQNNIHYVFWGLFLPYDDVKNFYWDRSVWAEYLSVSNGSRGWGHRGRCLSRRKWSAEKWLFFSCDGNTCQHQRCCQKLTEEQLDRQTDRQMDTHTRTQREMHWCRNIQAFMRRKAGKESRGVWRSFLVSMWTVADAIRATLTVAETMNTSPLLEDVWMVTVSGVWWKYFIRNGWWSSVKWFYNENVTKWHKLS